MKDEHLLSTRLNYPLRKIRQYGVKSCIKKVIEKLTYTTTTISYSEQGEDILLKPFCPNIGFYVDVGAYHPNKISVTRMFYEKGWRGINIDPNPYSIRQFNRIRKRDINIQMGISDEISELNYYFWGKNDPSNTFDTVLYEQWCQERGHQAKEIIKVKVTTLNDLLDKYLPEHTQIDFLTIDVEGLEFRIVQSINFKKYSPRMILIEDLDYYNKNKDFMDFKETKLYKYLHDKGYIVIAKTWYTILFKKIE